MNLPPVLAKGGLLVLGHTKRDTLSLPPSWREKKLLKHGDTVMRFLTVESGTVSAEPEKPTA